MADKDFKNVTGSTTRVALRNGNVYIIGNEYVSLPDYAWADAMLGGATPRDVIESMEKAVAPTLQEEEKKVTPIFVELDMVDQNISKETPVDKLVEIEDAGLPKYQKPITLNSKQKKIEQVLLKAIKNDDMSLFNEKDDTPHYASIRSAMKKVAFLNADVDKVWAKIQG
jgi:hypothetical protein